MQRLRIFFALALAASTLAVGLPALARTRAPRLTPRGQAQIREIHRSTGYLLHDTGPRPNPLDRRGWSDREVRRMSKVLGALPQQLKFLGQHGEAPDGQIITRDAMSQQERTALRDAEVRLRQALRSGGPLKKRLKARAALTAVKALGALKLGSAFGHAYRDRPEIRLYNELFSGSRLPGLRKMLAFTTVHEIGHRQLFKDPALQRAWREHFFQRGGQQEYAGWCGYAAGSVDEGYGVGIGTFAVAPKLLQRKAPRTYAFFVERFGADAFKPLRGGPTERWAIQLTYKLGDLAAGLSKRR